MTKKEPREHALSKDDVAKLFEEYRDTGDRRARERIVEGHMNMVRFFARRFSHNPEMLEDLSQVATLGLINAVDRYDLDRGVEFITFATITILGEIKRFFRDKTWSVKVPRRIKDLNIAVNHAIEKLSKELDHAPTYEEIAREVGVSVEEIIESREAVQSYTTVSLNKEIEGEAGDGTTTLMDLLGNIDRKIDALSDHISLQTGLKQLKKDELFVIYNRYFGNLSQAQIAKEMNVSQMQVSRIQAQALVKLKRILSK